MKLIVGLGNIGDHFDGTRHNVGFLILDSINKDWLDKTKFKSYLAEINIAGEKAILLKPKTYYNLSGDAVLAVKNFYKIDNSEILVIHDELALPFGVVRTRLDSSDAGNNGVKSIIGTIGQDFSRVRVGIANDFSYKTDAADFVLGKFSREEHKKLATITSEVTKIIDKFATNNFEQTSISL